MDILWLNTIYEWEYSHRLRQHMGFTIYVNVIFWSISSLWNNNTYLKATKQRSEILYFAPRNQMLSMPSVRGYRNWPLDPSIKTGILWDRQVNRERRVNQCILKILVLCADVSSNYFITCISHLICSTSPSHMVKGLGPMWLTTR